MLLAHAYRYARAYIMYQIDNPTVTFFPNGSLLMLSRGGNPRDEASSDGIVTAPSWRGPYTMHGVRCGAVRCGAVRTHGVACTAYAVEGNAGRGRLVPNGRHG